MVRIAVIPRPQEMVSAVRCLRAHVDLPVGELRARLADGRPVAEFSFHDPLPDVQRCRALLRDVAAIGAQIRVYASVATGGEREETLVDLHNHMRNLIGISRETRDQMFREADASEDQA